MHFFSWNIRGSCKCSVKPTHHTQFAAGESELLKLQQRSHQRGHRTRRQLVVLLKREHQKTGVHEVWCRSVVIFHTYIYKYTYIFMLHIYIIIYIYYIVFQNWVDSKGQISLDKGDKATSTLQRNICQFWSGLWYSGSGIRHIAKINCWSVLLHKFYGAA